MAVGTAARARTRTRQKILLRWMWIVVWTLVAFVLACIVIASVMVFLGYGSIR